MCLIAFQVFVWDCVRHRRGYSPWPGCGGRVASSFEETVRTFRCTKNFIFLSLNSEISFIFQKSEIKNRKFWFCITVVVGLVVATLVRADVLPASSNPASHGLDCKENMVSLA